MIVSRVCSSDCDFLNCVFDCRALLTTGFPSCSSLELLADSGLRTLGCQHKSDYKCTLQCSIIASMQESRPGLMAH